jgi:hypothetical protein
MKTLISTSSWLALLACLTLVALTATAQRQGGIHQV